MNKFKVGSTYEARSNADWDTIFRWTVTKRTAKFVTLEDHFGEVNRVGVREDERGEFTLPYGTYSMAPVIRAGETV